MASSSMPYSSGNMMVVTHMLPAAQNMEQQPPLDRKYKFRKGYPQALGTVEIMIGALTLLFGIATAAHQASLGILSGIFVWGSAMYITAGALTVAAEKYMTRCLINTSLAFNIIAANFAIAGIVLYALDPVVTLYPYDFGDCDDSYGSCIPIIRHRYGGYSGVVAVFQFLEFIVAIILSAYTCHAVCCCSCCMEEPQVVVQAVEGGTQL
ncbi:membrane-spanning 4-domains subfamily A member 15-like isoform X2 [Salarias fasciatus]|uniref:membrane-spanning 4-domains subfamily A member 15-like isoform X2 n=1 Tax=Salarias fasciatus TaxID=181472 RepID=UPI0011767109|nr:membrane-spanning 4-domains subfamily A member 15-like isoform X2 [Salarias fasciatus]